MTFEEFIQKKKIDLALLKAGKPDLYAEFEKHFALMGEKSFDHTKKYLFNKLRHSFPLKEEPKPLKIEPKAAENLTEDKGEGTKPTSLRQAGTSGFKPRFKAGKIASANDTKSQTEASEPTENKENTSKAAYKPKFKPGAVKSKKNEQGDNVPENDSEKPAEQASAKPTYKPKFKPKVLKNKEEENADKLPKKTTGQTAAKPTYKPRFKSGMAKKNADRPADDTD